MGHISTPEGIDFTIQSPPLTDSERSELSDFIKSRKEQLKRTRPSKKKTKPTANKS